MNGIYVITGGNLQDRHANLALAIEELSKSGIIVLKKSSLFETEAWGNLSQPPFLNQVLQLQTSFTSIELLNCILEIEKKAGRIRDKKWESRILDIDILYYYNEIIRTGPLILPHPHIASRRFVLEPLAEIAGQELDPISGMSVWQMLKECSDKLIVKRLNS